MTHTQNVKNRQSLALKIDGIKTQNTIEYRKSDDVHTERELLESTVNNS
jgi:hypothetical protein